MIFLEGPEIVTVMSLLGGPKKVDYCYGGTEPLPMIFVGGTEPMPMIFMGGTEPMPMIFV